MNTKNLCSGRLEEGDEVLSLSFLLDSGEHHLGARDELLGRQQVLEKRLLAPGDALLDIGGGVSVTSGLASLATEEAVQVGSLLVRLTGGTHVALSALGLKNLSSFGNVTHFELLSYLRIRKKMSKTALLSQFCIPLASCKQHGKLTCFFDTPLQKGLLSMKVQPIRCVAPEDRNGTTQELPSEYCIVYR
jgi:hypothetical protein